MVYAAVIFIGSSISQPPSLPEIVSDKSVHGSLYAGLALVLLRALARRWDRVTLFTAAAAVVLATLYGASDEYHQSFVPGRTPDVADQSPDAIAATDDEIIARLVAPCRQRRSDVRH